MWNLLKKIIFYILVITLKCILVKTQTIPLINNTSACGSERPQVVNLKYGFFTSPKFDNFHYYPANQNCSWQFQAPPGQAIVFTRMVFSMNLNCKTDRLEFFDEFLSLGKFCGYYMSSRITSKTGNVTVRFLSGPSPSNVGFQLYFEQGFPIVNCSKNQIRCRHLTKCVDKTKLCDGIDDCKDGTDEEKCNYIALPAKCGVPEIKPALVSNRIVGGRDAIPGSWPWQVSLRKIELIPFGHMCGASLINTQWLLTAAHCFKKSLDVQLWRAHMGKYYKLIPDETEEIRYLESINIHPEYKGLVSKFSAPWLERKQHDIALVKLNAPVNVNTYIKPVCLPDRLKTLQSGRCYVTGWGDTYNTGFEYVLKQAAINVIPLSTCRSMYPRFPIAETMVCAGIKSGGHDSCQGDSGGPLVFFDDEKWNLLGIVSTGGSICAEKDQPGIYTSVSHYIDWIYDVMDNLTFSK